MPRSESTTLVESLYKKQLFDKSGAFRGKGVLFGRKAKDMASLNESLSETLLALRNIGVEVSQPRISDVDDYKYYEVEVVGQRLGESNEG